MNFRTWTDRVLAVGLMAASVLLAWRTARYGRSDLFGSPGAAFAYYSAQALAGGWYLTGFRGARASAASWLTLGARVLSIVMCGAAATRTIRQPAPNRLTSAWPPIERAASDAPFDALTPDERLTWAVRVAAHWFTGTRSWNQALVVPADWPLPPNVEIASAGDSALRRVAARAIGDHRICLTTLPPPADTPEHAMDGIVCRAPAAQDSGLVFHAPTRGENLARTPIDADSGLAWPQYRFDAARRADAAGRSAGAWGAQMRGVARSSPSVVDSGVFIGTHGLGSIEAFSLRDGRAWWKARVPNWVHQDVTGGHGVVVAGFGDNGGSFVGLMPAGVAAFDAATGALRWTAFEGNSVMTSPVIWRSAAVYITAAGVLRVRSLADGALSATLRLSGGAIMGPPLIRHDTLIVGLDEDHVCAVDLRTTSELWCTQVSGAAALGHSAVSLLGDTVYATANIQHHLSRLRSIMKRLTSWDRLPGSADSTGGLTGAQLIALDARDGRVVWRSDVFPAVRARAGHTSGTATADDSTIVVALPTSDVLLGFDRRSLRLRWRRPAAHTRGSPLMKDGRVYWLGRDGEFFVLNAGDGSVACSTKLPEHFDRGGPTLAGDAMLFASVERTLTAVPLADANRCAVGR
jgi:outer membrane protein assembly factor BamB